MTYRVLLSAAAGSVMLAANAAHAAGPQVPTLQSDHAKSPLVPVQRRLRPREVRQKLRSEGYRKINWIDRDLPVYRLEACTGNVRYRLRVNRFGEVRRRRALGPCWNAQLPGWANANRNARRGLSDNELRALLRQRGFARIRITDNELPGYGAEACRNGDRFRLRMNRFGAIRNSRILGSCRQQAAQTLRPRDLRELLRTRGFYKIEITDRRGPRYGAEACRGNNRVRVQIDDRGGIVGVRRLGSCRVRQADRGLGVDEIREVLRRRRYYRINFTDRRLPGLEAEACRNIRRFRLRLNRFGEITRRQRVGWCARPSQREVAAAPRQRVTDFELRGTGRIRAADCQDYLEALLSRNSILFDYDSADIDTDSFDLLNQLGRVIRRCPGAKIEVAGHTDSDGSNRYNQDLSERRAGAVATYLLRRGVPRRSLSAVGYGEERPVASNSTPAQKALNRRIEFVLDWSEG
ncbi:MAG: OmpA family protein [Pseudomonadota bacterium]